MLKHSSQYRKALDDLLSLEFTGMKLGLENIRELLKTLSDPHKKFESIHVAGSNGKGSVSSMLAAATQAGGYKTGLYTSPHLVDFRERIKVDGCLIQEEFILEFLDRIWKDVERLQATFFEVTTAMAFGYFAWMNVQVAIIETGLGGRLDATNILENPLAAVITSISLEHTAQLGNTIEEIASEKAGIMKAGAPTIVNVGKVLRNIFIAKGEVLNSRVHFVDDMVLGHDFQTLKSPLLGNHQEQNLRTVLATLTNIPLPLSSELMSSGISATKNLTGIRARMEEYDYLPTREKGLRFILDVAHNPDAFSSLKEYFQLNHIKPLVIAGFAKDKDISVILSEIKEFASKFIAVRADSHRAESCNTLYKEARRIGIESYQSGSPMDGVNVAKDLASNGEVLLLTGSHFVVGDFLKIVERQIT